MIDLNMMEPVIEPGIDATAIGRRANGRGIDRNSINLNQVNLGQVSLDQVKVTPRDRQVLNLLVQGCSNKEIAGQLNISPRTVKQHLRTLFLRAGIREGRKRVKLAIAMFSREEFAKEEFAREEAQS